MHQVGTGESVQCPAVMQGSSLHPSSMWMWSEEGNHFRAAWYAIIVAAAGRRDNKYRRRAGGFSP